MIKKHGIERFEYLLPDEYRLDKQLSGFCNQLSISSQAVDTEHFLTGRYELADFFEGNKTYVMERFYRDMRTRHNILMEDPEEPVSGRWNYDEENRKKIPAKVSIPPIDNYEYPFWKEVHSLLENAKVETIGSISKETFTWPVTREQALNALTHFIDQRLWAFGKYQDAMTVRDPFLFHSRLSFALNVKLLHPLEVVKAVEKAWEESEDVDLAQAEGFIRQVMGWREYMRGVYWAKMPEYSELNYFGHEEKLPNFYWTGNTRMRCLSASIDQSLEYAYAHHIQRLMVTGAFALLWGVHPDEVDQWYLGIYIDAIEWVEITNTRGMSQFADGGIVGTKPYAGSANYIHKMGDYCKNCEYDRKKRHGENACPFNSLYWDFFMRHENKLRKNARISMMYRHVDKMEEEERKAIRERADWLRAHPEEC